MFLKDLSFLAVGSSQRSTTVRYLDLVSSGRCTCRVPATSLEMCTEFHINFQVDCSWQVSYTYMDTTGFTESTIRWALRFPLYVPAPTTLLVRSSLHSNFAVFLLFPYNSRYGGISVGEANSQVLLTDAEIEDVFRDLRDLFGSSQVCTKYWHLQSQTCWYHRITCISFREQKNCELR